MTEDLLKKEICFNCHNWIHFEPEHIMVFAQYYSCGEDKA